MAERAVIAARPARVERAASGEANERKRGLAPVIGRDTRVLILGSFPGEASLVAGQYYAHPRNHFWPLVGALTGTTLATMSYRKRLDALRACGIGLWDVYVACLRRGSLDGAIRDAERGEVSRVRRAAPAVELVCFNGQTAARALPVWRDAGYATLALPSSSPAYTRPFTEKLARWRAIADFLEHGRADAHR